MSKSKKLLSALLAVVITMSAGVSTIASAAASTGWQKDGYGWWYKTSNGYHKNSWANIGGKWYWFNSNGYMQTGWKQIDGKWYYMDASGAMKTGWVYSGGKWYFMESSGAMKTGWVSSGGNWYYMDASGAMLTNTTVDGWKIDANGVATEIKSENQGAEDIYKPLNPTIDFSSDDGNMSKLHRDLRLMFEQNAFPQALYSNKNSLKKAIVNSPDDFMTFVDNQVWADCMSKIIIEYMMNSEETYTIASEEDLYNHMEKIADKYSLHAYQSYDMSAFKFNESTYCILFEMADIDDSLKVSEMDKLLISTYIAIVYDSGANTFNYYLLEKSVEDNYVLCSINASGAHSNYAVVENNKKAVLNKIKEITLN